MTKKSPLDKKHLLNKFVNAYFISSGFFGVFFIGFGFLNNRIPDLYGIFYGIFFTLYSLMLYVGIRSWIVKKFCTGA
ncbi:MAG: hypothetical protein ED557_04090 [Balneola sp.]|nr:MAG: hypothetical protein ED557_04090 [Balneola sp.]